MRRGLKLPDGVSHMVNDEAIKEFPDEEGTETSNFRIGGPWYAGRSKNSPMRRGLKRNKPRDTGAAVDIDDQRIPR